MVPHVHGNSDQLNSLLLPIRSIPVQNLMGNPLRHHVRPRPVVSKVQDRDFHAGFPLQVLEAVDVDLQPADHQLCSARPRRCRREREPGFHFVVVGGLVGRCRCRGAGDVIADFPFGLFVAKKIINLGHLLSLVSCGRQICSERSAMEIICKKKDRRGLGE